MTRGKLTKIGSVALLAWLANCSSDASGPPNPRLPITPETSVFQLAVSEPVASFVNVSASDGSSAGSNGGTVYVAFAAGEQPAWHSVRLSNRTSGLTDTTRYTVVDGGLDPIGIAADVGDTLQLDVIRLDGSTASLKAGVPSKRAPRVVRTSPGPGRVDVAVNVRILVVFSEPVDAATLTSATVRLLKGSEPVEGTFMMNGNGTSVEFEPAEALLPNTSYALVVNRGVQDLSGDSLQQPMAVEFRTEEAVIQAPPALVFGSLTNRQIYTVRMDGTGLTLLTNGGRNLRPAWSPDGRRIAFVRHDDNHVADIYLMDADGKQVVRRTAGSNFWWAAWSPDGRKLAVSTEGVYYSDIWIISADDDGSGPVHVATDARSPAWSPDGKKVAYVHTSGDDGYDAIYVMNADGTGATPLTAAWGGRYGVTWSPDGGRIASSTCVAAMCDVFVMNADGSDERRLTDVGTAQEAVWSPDGNWIAVSLWTYPGSNVAVSLAYIPAEGGTPRFVASDGFHPSWRR